MPHLTPQTLRTICEHHDKYWEDKRRDLYANKQCYETDFIDKSETYGTKDVPSGEINRSIPGVTAKNYDSLNKPIHPLADILVRQGLSEDPIRGTTTSSARRETPSNVFGISTPGPLDRTTTQQSTGTKAIP